MGWAEGWPKARLRDIGPAVALVLLHRIRHVAEEGIRQDAAALTGSECTRAGRAGRRDVERGPQQGGERPSSHRRKKAAFIDLRQPLADTGKAGGHRIVVQSIINGSQVVKALGRGEDRRQLGVRAYVDRHTYNFSTSIPLLDFALSSAYNNYGN